MIRFEAVGTKARRGTPALHDVTFSLPTGARVAVFGPPGAGKSTLLGLLTRLTDPHTGTIEWDGRPLRSHRRAALRTAVGWWSPVAGLFGERTVFDNIVTVPARLGWAENQQRARCFELLELLGLPRVAATRSPAELAPDQQAAVALARAVAGGPELVVGDNPFRDLPDDTAFAVAELARRVQPEWGDRWVIGTDTLAPAIGLADRLIVLDAGRILQDGPIGEVVELPAGPRVAELIGPDRGVRSLALQPASGLTPRRVATVRDPRTARPGEPTLLVDRNAQPLGWTRGNPAPDGEVLTAELGTSFSPATDSLRDALEAVLTSPTGLGVAVGETGRYLGVVDAAAIWELAGRRRAEVATARAEQAYAEREAARRSAAVDRGVEDDEGAAADPDADPESGPH